MRTKAQSNGSKSLQSSQVGGHGKIAGVLNISVGADSYDNNSTHYRIKDFALIRIDSIIIGTRVRKALGNIASLAKDISEIGLLHSIVINEDHKLICGVRRIEAFKALGKSEIPARIVNLDDIVKGEISENTQRKDFSWEEIIEIKKAVEPEIKKESEKRMLSGKPRAVR